MTKKSQAEIQLGFRYKFLKIAYNPFPYEYAFEIFTGSFP